MAAVGYLARLLGFAAAAPGGGRCWTIGSLACCSVACLGAKQVGLLRFLSELPWLLLWLLPAVLARPLRHLHPNTRAQCATLLAFSSSNQFATVVSLQLRFRVAGMPTAATDSTRITHGEITGTPSACFGGQKE